MNYKSKLGEILQGSLSDDAVNEIESLVESVIDEKVEEQMSDLEGRVAGFLKLKMGELRESAKRQITTSFKNSKEATIYESIKKLIASDLSAEDIASVSDFYEESTNDMQDQIDSLNKQLNESLQTNSVLEAKLSSMEGKNKLLERKAKLPFKTSEKAVIITRDVVEEESHDQVASQNEFLTEDVKRLI